MTPASGIWRDIEKIRAASPLVHNITNYVVMNNSANALLALGASPVMAHAPEEVEDMVALASALVINIGTLSGPWIVSMSAAVAAAKRFGIPFVLDPVGAGATPFRTETAHRLLDEGPPAVLRGNASEIRALHFAEDATKGVDSRHGAEEALEAARAISRSRGCVVCVSGAVDLVVRGDETIRVRNGHPMMPRVTGLGCTASALVGAFAAVNPSALRAAVHAMAVMGIAGEMAAEGAAGPGSLQVRLLDAFYTLREKDIKDRLKLEST